MDQLLLRSICLLWNLSCGTTWSHHGSLFLFGIQATHSLWGPVTNPSEGAFVRGSEWVMLEACGVAIACDCLYLKVSLLDHPPVPACLYIWIELFSSSLRGWRREDSLFERQTAGAPLARISWLERLIIQCCSVIKIGAFYAKTRRLWNECCVMPEIKITE